MDNILNNELEYAKKIILYSIDDKLTKLYKLNKNNAIIVETMLLKNTGYLKFEKY